MNAFESPFAHSGLKRCFLAQQTAKACTTRVFLGIALDMILGTCSFGFHQQKWECWLYTHDRHKWLKVENAEYPPKKNRNLGVPYFQTNPNIYGSVGVCNEIYGFVHISLQPIPEWGERLEFYTIYPLKNFKRMGIPQIKASKWVWIKT